MEIFLRIYKHLLPRARAWRITINKQLRQFFTALSDEPNSIREFFDARFFDIFPETTTAIPEFLGQFNLFDTGSEVNNRLAIAAAWRLNNYQSETDIQDTIHAAGFTNVFIHEWWEEPVVGSPVARNAVDLVGGDDVILAACGEPLTQCGEPSALCGNFLSNADVLVNKTDSGGGFSVPTDPATWPFFLYVGAETFPDKADVLESQKNEFETLLLKICPAQQWIGLRINYL